MKTRKSVSEFCFGIALTCVLGLATSASSEVEGAVVAVGVAGAILFFALGLLIAPKPPEDSEAAGSDPDRPLTIGLLRAELAEVRREVAKQGRGTAFWALLGILIGVALRFWP